MILVVLSLVMAVDALVAGGAAAIVTSGGRAARPGGPQSVVNMRRISPAEAVSWASAAVLVASLAARRARVTASRGKLSRPIGAGSDSMTASGLVPSTKIGEKQVLAGGFRLRGQHRGGSAGAFPGQERRPPRAAGGEPVGRIRCARRRGQR